MGSQVLGNMQTCKHRAQTHGQGRCGDVEWSGNGMAAQGMDEGGGEL